MRVRSCSSMPRTRKLFTTIPNKGWRLNQTSSGEPLIGALLVLVTIVGYLLWALLLGYLLGGKRYPNIVTNLMPRIRKLFMIIHNREAFWIKHHLVNLSLGTSHLGNSRWGALIGVPFLGEEVSQIQWTTECLGQENYSWLFTTKVYFETNPVCWTFYWGISLWVPLVGVPLMRVSFVGKWYPNYSDQLKDKKIIQNYSQQRCILKQTTFA